MTKILLVCTFLSAFLLIGCGQAQSSGKKTNALFDDEEFGDPSTQGPYEQCRGAPWQGHLVNPTDIGFAGPGFIKIFREREARFATFDLVAVIKKGVQKLQQDFPESEPIQLGDLSVKSGGPVASHESHQCGVDSDIRFLSNDHRIQPDANTGFEEQFVADGKVTPNFDMPRNWALISGFFSTGRVNRIFVAGPIKKALCTYASSLHQKALYKNAFRRLVVLENHTDHMHLRISCPKNSPLCQMQPLASSDNDCR